MLVPSTDEWFDGCGRGALCYDTAVLSSASCVLSFGMAVPEYSSDPFPVMGPPLIAPFWADVDTRGTGEIYYKETNDSSLLDSTTLEFLKAFDNFSPTSLFVATWDGVGYFDNNTDLVGMRYICWNIRFIILTHNIFLQTNTFQCVLATDGNNSFVIFVYDDIQWATADSRTSNDTTPTQIGFNAGDGMRFTTVSGSQTDAVLNLNSTSNVNVRGLWIYKVDGDNIGKYSLFIQ